MTILQDSPTDMSMVSNDDTSGFQAKYTIKEVLGRGASSVVKRCVEKATGKEFAVKIVDLTGDSMTDTDDVTELYNGTINEISVLRLLAGHPNIIELHDVFESSAYIFLVFELCKNGELFDYLNRVVTVSEKKTRMLMRQLLQVVEFMHSRNVVHRDLKPENILLDDDLNIKVTDFGFAAIVPEGQQNSFTDLCGTPGFLAPEVLKQSMYQGQPPYGRAVDLWASGVICYTLLAGYPPFWHRRQMMMLRMIMEGQYSFAAPEWEDISAPPKALIKALLTVDPAKRITATEALALEFFQIGTQVEEACNARHRLKRTLLMVRCAIRITKLNVTMRQTTIKLACIQRDPYRQRVLRKALDGGAFKIYGHWVKRSSEQVQQNRAVMFQNSVKREMMLLAHPSRH
ncbi:hypothetical protein RvY_14685 [Ramazzottius varieornatus]|uniref:phosphorylase kinase n=1 Tax=Ramazzottius varieornatus TaxID=947166 RepID=A0A1D1VS59_RAMVA|nr:hypothetical protein RvY_14685 [Ramazzottius varieornatus]